MNSDQAITIWTIGHSTRSIEDFLQILIAHDIHSLVDVRSFPGSRRYPQFNKTALSGSLAAKGIAYFHLPVLGGRRTPLKNSRNTAWRNASFRGYADYIDSYDFKKGIADLLSLARVSRVAIMCAEALWWRCHRSLIADYLKAKGMTVLHIMDQTEATPHPYTSAARVLDGELSYEGLFAGEQGNE